MKKQYTLLLLVVSFIANSQCFTKISSGESHIVVTKSNNSLWAWGWGASGQLGNGIEFDEYQPFSINTINSWNFTDAGEYNSFGIKTDGTLWSTGSNVNGSLGINSTIINTTILTQIGTATNWKQVSAGGFFTVATKTDNTLWGWGQNNSYQMGNNTCCADRLSPGLIGTDTNWKLAIACTSARVGLALKTNGTLWGWGGNSGGLIGESNISSRSTPTQLSTDTDWETLATGAAHVLALKTNGTLWAWGVGFNGQTADNLTPLAIRSTPLQIGTDTYTYIACGFQQSFAIKSNGTLWAWGRNDFGQLGDGTTIERRQPVQIGTDTDWVAVAAGYRHGAALKSNGALYTWGYNDFGQLGTGAASSFIQTVPTYVPVAGCTLGVDGFNKSSIAVYPNPTDGLVYIADNNGKFDTVSVYNTLGQEVLKPFACAQGETVDLHGLPSGVYLFTFRSENNTLVKRVVKN